MPGACDSTLLIAQRVQPYDDVWAERDRMPVFPVPDGHDQESWLRHEVGPGWTADSPTACRRSTPTGPSTRSTSSAARASRPTS